MFPSELLFHFPHTAVTEKKKKEKIDSQGTGLKDESRKSYATGFWIAKMYLWGNYPILIALYSRQEFM